MEGLFLTVPFAETQAKTDDPQDRDLERRTQQQLSLHARSGAGESFNYIVCPRDSLGHHSASDATASHSSTNRLPVARSVRVCLPILQANFPVRVELGQKAEALVSAIGKVLTLMGVAIPPSAMLLPTDKAAKLTRYSSVGMDAGGRQMPLLSLDAVLDDEFFACIGDSPLVAMCADSEMTPTVCMPPSVPNVPQSQTSPLLSLGRPLSLLTILTQSRKFHRTRRSMPALCLSVPPQP